MVIKCHLTPPRHEFAYNFWPARLAAAAAAKTLIAILEERGEIKERICIYMYEKVQRRHRSYGRTKRSEQK